MRRWAFILLYAITALLAVSCIPKYEESGMRVFQDPSDVSNSLLYFGLILVFTAFILVMAKKSEKFLRFFMYFLVFVSVYYVLIPFLGVLSLVIAVIVIALLIKKPNWMVINASALLLAAGITSMFGISLEPLPVIILLAILAIYDALSVYRTGHMIDLADSVIKIGLPMLFVIPSKEDKPMLLGVGDVVIPNILVVSAQTFVRAPIIGFLKIPALTALLGGILGMVALVTVAERFNRPHAGLPFLNTGAILGFVIGLVIARCV